MGTTTSRDNSKTRLKRRHKLPSLKTPRHKGSSLNDSPTSPIEPKRTARQPIPVKLVKHQVVLSDHVSPMSTLSAMTSIPVRRSSWIKSLNSITTKATTFDNTSYTSSSSYYDEDEDDEIVSSPRTSLGSAENNHHHQQNNHVLKDEDKKKKKQNSFYPFKSHHYNKKNESDFVFESKYTFSIASPSTKESFSPPQPPPPPLPSSPPKGPQRPFWVHNNSDEKEYDR